MQISVEAACERYGLGAEVIHDWLRQFRRSALLAFDERLKQTLIAQGGDAAVLSAPELTGTLEDISIADVLQSMQVAGKSAVIVVTRDGVESRVWCFAGTVIDAESGPLRGEAALHRILGFEHGRVVAELRPTGHERVIFVSTPRLLLEAAHRKDEVARLWRKLADGQQLYGLTERGARARASMSEPELSLLASFQEARSLRDVLAHSELGDLETLTLLARWIDDQVIESNGAVVLAPAVPSDAQDSIASFLTLTGTRPSDSALATRWFRHWPGWVWATLALVVLVPAAFWLPSRWLAPGLPLVAELASLPAPAVASAQLAPTYSVTTTVEPSHAEVWLDRRKLATGHLSTVLSRDGAVHELRVEAPGYLPAIVWFADTPPLAHMRLERMPAPPAAVPAPGEATPANQGKGVASVLAAPIASKGKAAQQRQQKPLKSVPAARRRPLESWSQADATATEASSPLPPPTQAKAPRSPHIQVIE